MQTKDTKAALIESIFEGDDDALQALADLYEEEGDPARGDLVRVQTELGAFMADDDVGTPLFQRFSELMKHWGEWLAHLPKLPGIHYDFERGVPRAVADDGNALRQAAQALANIPEVRAVNLNRVDGVNSLVGCEYLNHFRSVSFGWSFISSRKLSAALSALADCPHLRNITELRLAWLPFDSKHLKIIENAPHWKGLVRLYLVDTKLAENVTGVLQLVGDLPRLRHLDLSNNKIPKRGLQYLSRASSSEGLKSMELLGCGLTDECIEHLCRSEHAPSLTTLDLRHNKISSDGAMELAESNRFSELRQLKLTGCQIGQYVLRRLRKRFGDGLIV